MNNTAKYMTCAALGLLAAASLSYGQDYSAVLESIEENNTTLKALRELNSAEKLEARTGLTPEDPELGLAYLWETKAPEGGYRINIDFTQSFDFPTAYYWRKKLSDGQCRASDLNFMLARKAVLLEAEKLCIELSYLSSLRTELERCRENALRIMETRQAGYECGEQNLLNLNEAKLALLSADKLLRENAIETQSALSELERLNGGKGIDQAIGPMALPLMPENFEDWYETASLYSSELLSSEAELEIAETARKLATAEVLPKFSIGYVSERVASNTLEGIGGGISIPLWGSAGKLKAAKAKVAAAKAKHEDDKLQFFSALKLKYDKALEYAALARQYNEELSSISTVELLYEALEGGQIGMEEYLSGIDLWYEALMEAMASEREALLLIAEMESFAR